MAATCPQGFDVGRLRASVRETYERVAREPNGTFHFHRGLEYAVRFLHYDRTELEALPRLSTEAFAGVGNPHRAGLISPGDTVLDHACGAGMDLLLAATRVGARGRAIGVDMTAGMRRRAAAAARALGFGARVDVREGLYESLPVDTASVDVVVSNGVVNLAPDKRTVLREIARVLKPGGQLLLADVVVARELKLEARSNPDLWAACIAGALREGELIELAAEAGLVDGRIVERYECFQGTSAEDKVSKDLRVHGVSFRAVRA